jgi:hypothetical protein
MIVKPLLKFFKASSLLTYIQKLKKNANLSVNIKMDGQNNS